MLPVCISVARTGYEKRVPLLWRRVAQQLPNSARYSVGQSWRQLKSISVRRESASWSITPSLVWTSTGNRKVSHLRDRGEKVRQIEGLSMENQSRTSRMVGPAGLEPATRPL